MATFEKRQYRNPKTGKTTIRYKAKIRLKAFPYEEATFDRKTDAQEWAAKREYELLHQHHFGVQAFRSKTVNDLFDRYEQALKMSNPKRHKSALPVIKVWKKRLGHIKLCELSRDRVIQERDWLKSRHVKDKPKLKMISNAAVNRQMAVLKRALNVAVAEWGWLAHNPANIKSLPEPKGRTRFLQNEELGKLLDACKASENPHLLATVVLAITTGARRGEVVNIRLKDVDFEAKRIYLPMTKNGKPRSLFLSGYALELVRGIHAKAKAKQVYLFASPHNVLRPNDFRTAWRTAIKRSGLTDFKFHDCRHCAASFYALNGAGLHQIAEILGHSSYHVTKRYTHLLETETAKVVENTAAKVFGSDETGLEKTE